ncbi:SpaH/EbpB family LPXTG-anchored major pilin [Actinomyces weissii]|uniref:SpaH/EbpB family LPXTG-anchored major pilin n=1 Tax=Actinomyces weissii TaxID=675090 RepID=A0A7T7MAK7_9ACTO|nr:SpaH/EbpB family LPXTG-anchored major pilin [Actinomyces weissii]QQM67744.1 SpaH/EbpB family LPXTG-anchored major pilin [Actinomyces weissii]
MSSIRIRRGIGLAVSATLAAAALAAPAGAAAPTTFNVDPSAPTTLTVHKCEQTDDNGNKPGTGNQDDSVNCTPVNDVEFTITELDYDLTTQKGWVDLAAANGDVNKAVTQDIDGDSDHKQGAPVKKVTAGGGLAVFSDAETSAGRAYLVSETKTPAGVIPAADFIVTLPMTNPADTSKWNYDVHVYPKNILNGIDKTVKDSEAASGSGNALTYTITTSIPKVGTEGIKKYQIIDALDGRVQTGLDAQQLNPRVEILGLAPGLPALDKGDYDIVVRASKRAPADTRNYLTVDFKPSGLKKLADARSAGTNDTKVQLLLTATFAPGTNLDGGITNQASLVPNDSPNYTWDKDNPDPGPDPSKPNLPGTSSETVVSKYGDLEITKTGTDKSPDGTKYNGAEFQVYECSVPLDDAALAEANIAAKNGSVPVLLKDVNPVLKRDPLAVDGQTVFVTGQATNIQKAKREAPVDGKLVIGSLRANDWENGAAKELNKDNWYCLVETKAPAGYSLAPDPIPFRVLASDTTDTSTDTQVTVVDVPANAGLHLPLTGASGVVFLTTLGGLLVLGGGGVALYNHRRRTRD